MLHGRHDRKIEGGGRANHRADPMRLARVQQSNSQKVSTGRTGVRRDDVWLAQSSAATLSKNE
jgi:hypothetical protein